MGEGSQNVKKSRGERLKSGVDLINALFALLGTVVLVGFAVVSWAVFGDLRPARAFLDKALPGSVSKEERGEAAQVPSQRANPVPSSPVYLSMPSADSPLEVGLLQRLHGSGIQVTDNPAQSAVILEAAINVALRPGITVGSSTAWQATASSSLKALDSRTQATLLWTMFEGHGIAMQPDVARQHAVTDAADHLAADYETFAKTGRR